jgi:glutaredoxin
MMGQEKSAPKAEPAAEDQPASNSIADEIKKHRVVVAGGHWCGFCNRAKEQLQAAKIEYQFVELGKDRGDKKVEENRQILDSLSGHGRCSMPYFFVDGKYSGGCNDGPEPWMGVRTMLQNDSLKKILASEPKQ